MKNLSIVIPVYNEKDNISRILAEIEKVTLIEEIQKEIVIIDDCSTDGTREILKEQFSDTYTVLFHDKNYGKGKAIRTGLEKVTGDYVIIQDADLEYDPKDYNTILRKILEEKAEVVYGSRRLLRSNKKHSGFLYFVGGEFLTRITNMLYKTKITDEATCYKCVKTSLIKDLDLKCERFEFCPEVTAKIAKRGVKIHEVPITYNPRSKKEGKKIRLKDGVDAVKTLVKLKFQKS